jgi:copper chaperone
MSKVELKVDGMTCGGCSGRLKRVLEGTDGVDSAEIVLAEKSVTVGYNERAIGLEVVKSVIADAGFTVLSGQA